MPDSESIAARLLDPDTDIKIKSNLAIELRDGVDSFQTTDYAQFLKVYVDAIEKLLRQGSPTFDAASPEQKLRHTLLELLHRFPHNELLRPYAQMIMDLIMYLLRIENEDNAVICLKLIIDLHRSYKQILEAYVQPFLDIVQQMFKNLETAVETAFGGGDKANQDNNEMVTDGDEANKPMARSLYSFKVLTECPIIVVLLFQTYRSTVNEDIQVFIPLVVNALRLEAKPQQEARIAVEAEGKRLTGISPTIQDRHSYGELIITQVKIMSFLAYVLRSFPQAIQKFQPEIASFAVRLLQDCPTEASTTRKELLVATRHILSSDLRSSFVSKIDSLLEADVLVGRGVTAGENLRPLAYSMLADLIHHVRSELTLAQLDRTVEIYSRLLHDPTLPASIQTMCAKLLLNLIDCIIQKETVQGCRLLLRILSTYVERLGVLKTVFPKLYALSSGDEIPLEVVLNRKRPIQVTAIYAEGYQDPIKDARFLLRNLIAGLKTILFGLRHSKHSTADFRLYERLFENGIECIIVSDSRDDKDMMEHFSTVYIHLDPPLFQEILHVKMDFFVSRMISCSSLLIITQFFLSAEASSANFSGLILQYLVGRLADLGSNDRALTGILLRLFKMVFMAVSLFPEANELALQPYIAHIIVQSLRFAATAEQPTNYFQLLRSLFRSIGGGRFELLYKEVLPLLQHLLETLNNYLSRAESGKRDLFVELCLTVPVRLSVLLPYLGYLMRPLVIALQAGPELVSQGLRTLELCVDNLTQEFLDPIMAPVVQDLMYAMWKHLAPSPYNHVHAHSALRILGKMGGRNRKLLYTPPQLHVSTRNSSFKCSVSSERGGQALSLDAAIEISGRALKESSSQLRNHALNFLDIIASIAQSKDDAFRSQSSLEYIARALCNGFASLDLIDEVSKILLRICTELTRAEVEYELQVTADAHTAYPHDHALPEILSYAIEFVYKLDTPSVKEARSSLKVIIRKCLEIMSTMAGERVTQLPILSLLTSRFCLCCYDESFAVRNGGCAALSTMIENNHLGTLWLVEQETTFLRALLFVIKDMPTEAVNHLEDIQHIPIQIIKLCNRPGELEEGTYLAKFNEVVSVLAPDIANPNTAVRETVQSLFQLLADLTGSEVTEILMPVRDRLLHPIFFKPLRALPFSMQIGNIDAITFCLLLRPPFLTFKEELLRLLHEALALADADDRALVGPSSQYKSNEMLASLRAVCIRVLSAAMTNSELSLPEQSATRARIISVFFKTLYSKSPEVVSAAHKGLKQVLAQHHKLPKDLLQTGLRPVLMNLSDHKRLTVQGLEGLARLLELLTNYFKVEIGRKLLEHLRAWSDPEFLQKVAGKSLKDLNEIKIMDSIINIFHLLPAAANCFLDELTTVVNDLNLKLRRSMSSPFIGSFSKYIDKYASEALQLFYRRIDEPGLAELLAVLVITNEAPKLRREIESNLQAFYDVFFDAKKELTLHGMNVIMHITTTGGHTQPKLQKSFIDALLSFWSGTLKDRVQSDHSPLRSGELSALSEIVLSSMQTDLDHFGIENVIRVVNILWPPRVVDLGQFRDRFYKITIIDASVSLRRKMLQQFLSMLANDQLSNDNITLILRHLINPLLLAHFNGLTTSDISSTNQLIDSELIGQIQQSIWVPGLSENVDSTTAQHDALRIEMLQMSTLLVQYSSDAIKDSRKDLIKFGWNYIKMEDVTGKMTAYVLICQFLTVFDSPAKMVMQVYIALLRAQQSDAKALLRRALDILTEILPARIGQPATMPFPNWAKWTRRVLVEDGHNVTQLVSIYHLLARHPDLFYTSRVYFVPHIVNSLSKLGLLQNANVESRALTIELVDLIVKWERLRQEVPGPSATSETTSPSEPKSVNEYSLPLSLRETTVSYLVRFVCTAAEPISKQGVVHRAMNLLQILLSANFWPEVNVKLTFFERTLVLSEISENNLGMICNSLEVLKIITLEQSDDWFEANAAQMQKLLENGMKTDNLQILQGQAALLKRMYSIVDLDTDDSALQQRPNLNAFGQWTVNLINEGLQLLHNPVGLLHLLQAFINYNAHRLDQFTPLLTKILPRWIKEHIAQAQTQNVSESSLENITQLLNLLYTRMNDLGDHRRWVLSAQVQIIEKSPSLALCRDVLCTMRRWILSKEPYPTMKEKAGILNKMMSFEARGDDELLDDFLTLVLEIYCEEEFARTDLTVKLEPAFMMGTRCGKPALQDRFLQLIDESIPRSIFSRLQYVFATQNWDSIADRYWLKQALYILLGAFAVDSTDDADVAASVSDQARLIEAYRHLAFVDTDAAHNLWQEIFPSCWLSLTPAEQDEISRAMTHLLSKDFHLRQAERRPNVISTLIQSLCSCWPPPVLPPHLVKYLGKTYEAWYSALEYLQILSHYADGDSIAKDAISDSVAELFAGLSDHDLFYGLWRRRCLYLESNVSLSYEQAGLWQHAQNVYENAQVKARSGLLPYTESEYCLWEDHWMLCSQKLQQWDILAELARHEGNDDLLLESAWRTADWVLEGPSLERAIASAADAPTPRRKVFEAFLHLLHIQDDSSRQSLFTQACDEGIQATLRKWQGLPATVTQAHIPLLEMFQKYVELSEAHNIFNSLAATTALNLDARSQELKNILQSWRERLPNLWDDINVWSDLVSWRQHIFSAINKAYLPLIPQLPTTMNGPNGNQNSFAYRGYHEIAWIINRFAHVARKHQLPDVCINSLTKIYTLPNIEIHEAFLKLREQAKCHYQNISELTTGLEVINNTNLMYFGPQQKAEFFALKAMFLDRLGLHEEANAAFSAAVQIDMTLAKAWAEWGQYNDRLFKERPNDFATASNAASCYLQAAGLYKNHKGRKLLLRVLWLVGRDDQSGSIQRAFDVYRGEIPVWYWVVFIPQLLSVLSHREGKMTRNILIKIAKAFPQALYYQLRTNREEIVMAYRQASSQQLRQKDVALPQASETSEKAQAENTIGDSDLSASPVSSAQGGQFKATSRISTVAKGNPDSMDLDDANNEGSVKLPKAEVVPGAPGDSGENHSGGQALPSVANNSRNTSTQTQDAAPSLANGSLRTDTPGHTGFKGPTAALDEVMAILKTAWPLLSLTIESMVEQIVVRLKPGSEEDIYRFVSALLQEGTQQLVTRSQQRDLDTSLPRPMEYAIFHFSETLVEGPMKVAFREDFVAGRPTLMEYIHRLRHWRDRLEAALDRRPKKLSLESGSHYLTDFQHQRFDEVEIPGQYLAHVDNNAEFVKIARFLPYLGFVRSHGFTSRRLQVRGHNGTLHSFAAQLPSSKLGKREEKMHQLFRIMNTLFEKRIETRRRNISLPVPTLVSLNPQVRLMRQEPTVITLQHVYEAYCKDIGLHKDAPLVKMLGKYQNLQDRSKGAEYSMNLKLEILHEIMVKLVPETALETYMVKAVVAAKDIWLSRRQFMVSYAADCFLSYVFSITQRHPHKIHIDLGTGDAGMTELVPAFSTKSPAMADNEPAPFRLTPNIQVWMTPVGLEGVFASALMAIGRTLMQKENEFEQRLNVFIRDEHYAWCASFNRPITDDSFYEAIQSNLNLIIQRTNLISCKMERENKVAVSGTPILQSVITLISQSTNPQNLASMEPRYMAYF